MGQVVFEEPVGRDGRDSGLGILLDPAGDALDHHPRR